MDMHTGRTSARSVGRAGVIGAAVTIAVLGLGLPFRTGVATAAAPSVYVTNTNGNTVTVLSKSLKELHSISGFNDPVAVAFTPGGKTAYVANNGGDAGTTIGVIDTRTHSRLPDITLPTGAGPVALAVSPDGQALYVALVDGYVSVISTATNAVTTTIPVATFGNLGGIVVSPDGSTVYASLSSGDAVYVISTASNTVVGTPITVGSNPSGMAITTDGQTLYVGNYHSGTVSVVDTATASVTNTINVGSGSNPADVAVTKDQKYLFVTNVPDYAHVTVITTSNDHQTQIPGFDSPIGVATDGDDAYVANNAGADQAYKISHSKIVNTLHHGLSDELPEGVAVQP